MAWPAASRNELPGAQYQVGGKAKREKSMTPQDSFAAPEEATKTPKASLENHFRKTRPQATASDPGLLDAIGKRGTKDQLRDLKDTRKCFPEGFWCPDVSINQVCFFWVWVVLLLGGCFGICVSPAARFFEAPGGSLPRAAR